MTYNSLSVKIFLYIYFKLNYNKNMFDKILAKLKEQRENGSNVSDRTLEDLSRTYEAVITTDEQLDKMDFTNAIKSINGNLGQYASTAVKKHEDDAKKKAEEEAARSKQSKKKKSVTDAEEEEEEETVPSWAQSILEKVDGVVSTVSKMQQEKVTVSRSEKLNKVLNGMPDYFKKPITQGFNNLTFEKEEDFDVYLQGVTSSKDEFTQASKEKGITFPTPGTPKVEVNTGESPVLAKAREIANKQKEQQTQQNQK